MIETMFCCALIAQNQNKKAKDHLIKIVKKQIDDQAMYFALTQLLKVSFETEDPSQFLQTLNLFKEKFANDTKIPLFEYHLALIYKNTNQLEQAIEQFLIL